MELEELKNRWNEFDNKLEKSLNLNKQLLRKMNFDKARFKLKMVFVYKLIEMLVFMYLISWFSQYAIKYFPEPHFGIPALIIDLFVLLGFLSDLRQISMIIQIQITSYNGAIAPLQKKLETLKIMIVDHVKYSYFVIPFFPLMLILGGKVFYNIDFLDKAHLQYTMINVYVAIGLIPLVFMLYLKLSKKEITPGIVKNFLQGTGWSTVNSARNFLIEIEEFEKDA